MCLKFWERKNSPETCEWLLWETFSENRYNVDALWQVMFRCVTFILYCKISRSNLQHYDCLLLQCCNIQTLEPIFWKEPNKKFSLVFNAARPDLIVKKGIYLNILVKVKNICYTNIDFASRQINPEINKIWIPYNQNNCQLLQQTPSQWNQITEFLMFQSNYVSPGQKT